MARNVTSPAAIVIISATLLLSIISTTAIISYYDHNDGAFASASPASDAAAKINKLFGGTSTTSPTQQQQQQQTQNQNKQPTLIVLSQNAFNDNNEFLPTYHIVGEVQNNGTTTAKFVQVSATLYNSDNKVVGTDSTYTNPSEIEPGQTAPFEIRVSARNVMGGDFSIIDHYSIRVSKSFS